MPQPTAGTIVAHFIAGVGETFSSDPSRLDQWDDQSGNAYHATQATSGNRFYDESLTPTSNNSVDDVVNSRDAIGGVGFQNFLNLHASQPTDFRNCAILVVHRKWNSPLQQVVVSLSIACPLGFDGSPVLSVNGSGQLQWTSSPIVTASAAASTPTSGANVYGFLGRSDGGWFAYGDRIIQGGATPAAGSTTGGLLGRGNAGGSLIPCAGSFYEIVYLSDLDLAGFTEWAEWLSGKYNWGNAEAYVAKTSSLLTVGDSTLAGEPIYQSTSIIPERLAYYFPSTHVTTGAVNGMTVATTGGNQVDQQILRGQYMLSGSLATGEASHPQPVRICMIMAGTNDINGGVSAADIKTAFTARVSEAKGYGATHVAICTIMDSTFHDSAEDAVRAQVNTDIKNLASGIDHDIVINLHESAFGGDDRLNDATANVGGLFEDGLHPSAAGRDVIVDIIRNNLAPYLGAESIGVGNPAPDDDIFLVGRTYEINWTSVGVGATVNIRLSIDGGSTFPITLESAYTDTETYDWTPTNDHVGTETVIRVEDSSDDTIYGQTDGMIAATTTPSSGDGTVIHATENRHAMLIPETTTELKTMIRLPGDPADVTFDHADLSIAYRVEGQATFTTLTLVAGTIGIYLSSSFVREAAGSSRYQVCWPSAAIVSGSKTTVRITYDGVTEYGRIDAVLSDTDEIDLWTKRNAVILSGLVTGAGTGTEVFQISALGITATVTVDNDGNRSNLVWS
jgi:lysophospholipase L1-like esterase